SRWINKYSSTAFHGIRSSASTVSVNVTGSRANLSNEYFEQYSPLRLGFDSPIPIRLVTPLVVNVTSTGYMNGDSLSGSRKQKLTFVWDGATDICFNVIGTSFTVTVCT